ncbi:hypothetical protein [Bradyrhizobium guangdongense]|nr:hypothetical protein [Bradyrhizobium guangdongense]
MTTTLVWTGVALWLGLNAAIAARCLYIARPVKVASSSARVIYLSSYRA